MQPLAPPVPATDPSGSTAAQSFDFAFDVAAFAADVAKASAPANQPAAVGSPIGSDAGPARSQTSSPEVSGSTSPHSFSLKKPSSDREPAALKLDDDHHDVPSPAAARDHEPTEDAAKREEGAGSTAPNPNATPFTPTGTSDNSLPAYNPNAAPVPGQPAPPATRTNVYIAWLPRSFLENDLLNLVAPFGDIVSVRLVQDASRSYAFVLYESREAAEGALVGLNTTRVNGRRLQARISSAHDGNRGPKPLGGGPSVTTVLPPPPPFGAAPMMIDRKSVV